MNLLHELDRVELFRRHKDDKQLRYLCIGLSCRHCYRIELSRQEFGSLVINSSPSTPKPNSPGEFPTVESALNEINNNRRFLVSRNDGEGLSGTRIQQKIDEFEQGASLANSFIVDADILLPGRTDEYYVIDGMHRLVGHGIWSGRKFPITAIYCTNRNPT